MSKERWDMEKCNYYIQTIRYIFIKTTVKPTSNLYCLSFRFCIHKDWMTRTSTMEYCWKKGKILCGHYSCMAGLAEVFTDVGVYYFGSKWWLKFVIPEQLLISRLIWRLPQILIPFYNQKCFSILTSDLLNSRRRA